MENERVQGSKKNWKLKPPEMEKEHTSKEIPQKNKSGALRRYYKRGAAAAAAAPLL